MNLLTNFRKKSGLDTQLVVLLLLVASLLGSYTNGIYAKSTVSSVQLGRAGNEITAKEMVGLRKIAAFAVSQNGNFVAYQVRAPLLKSNSYRLTWFVVPAKGYAPRPVRVAGGGQVNLEIDPMGILDGEFHSPSIAWSTDGREIFFTRKDHGAVQIWRAKRDGSGAAQLTHNPANVMKFLLSPKGTKMFFTVGRNRDYMRKSDEAEGAKGFLVQNTLTPPYSQSDSTVPGAPPWPLCGDYHFYNAWVNKKRACRQILWVKDLDSGATHRATVDEQKFYQSLLRGSTKARHGSEVQHVSLVPSPNGGRIAWLANENPARYRGILPLRRLTVSKRDHSGKVSCVAAACSGQFLHILGWDGTEVIFAATDGPGAGSVGGGSLSSFYGWVPGASTVRVILRTDDYMQTTSVEPSNAACELDVHLGNIICIREGWTQPNQIVAIGVDNGHIRVLADPNPWFKNIATTKIEKLVWGHKGEASTYGHLIFPRNYKKGHRYPLVITQYISRGFLWDNFTREAPAGLYSKNGLMVLSFNMPENTLKLFGKSDNGYKTVKAWWSEFDKQRPVLKSLEQILDYLDQQGLIDPKHVGISGLSTGASVVDQALLHTRRFAAASAAYSITGPINYYLLGGESYRKIMSEIYGGPPFGSGLKEWRKHSVGLNASCINVPFLIQVADREYYSTIQDYIDLKDARKPVELYVFPNEYHVKWQPVHHYNIYRRNVQWYKFWLLDKESDDPVDEGQYVRWRKLRKLQEENTKIPLSPSCPNVHSAH